MTAPTDNPILLAALDYAARGWPVFPCSPKTKQPLTAKESAPGAKDGGLHLASTDETQIRAWWGKSPRAMIGIPTGPRTGNVIDLDIGEPTVVTGAAYLARLREHVGGLPDTAIAETGSGGLHIWFAADPEAPIANGANVCPALVIPPAEGATRADGRKAKGAAIDVRGEGGYVIVPPSVREDGRSYTWCPGPEDGIAAPSEALLRILTKEEQRADKEAKAAAAAAARKASTRIALPPPATDDEAERRGVDRYAAAALDAETGAVARMTSGGRNDALNTAAMKLGSLVAAGALGEQLVRDRLLEAAEECGLTADDGLRSVLATIESGLQAGLRSPRDLSGVRARERRARAWKWTDGEVGPCDPPGANDDSAPTTSHQEAAAPDVYERLIEEAKRTYPLPTLSGMQLVYEVARGREVWLHRVTRLKDGEAKLVRVATPFGVPARLCYVPEGDFGLRIAVRDMRGRPKLIDVRREEFAKMGAGEARRLLFGAGLIVEDEGESIAIQCLKAANPRAEILVVAQPGWHECEGVADPFFVCPDGEVIGAPKSAAYELAMGVRMPESVARAGSADGWRTAVETAVTIENVEHWTLAACAAFAGVLASLAGLSTCGLNFSGVSSRGKTTAQKIAVSAWSTPDLRKPGLAQSAKATVNAMEALAARANGTIASFDELAHVRGHEVERMIYTFASGVGRQRLNSDAALKTSYTWTTFVILSAEMSLAEKVQADEGGDWVAGMAVRFSDINVSDTNGSVPREQMDRIASIEQHYGHAGPAFVRELIARGIHRGGARLREAITAKASAIVGRDGSDGMHLRAAIPLALLSVAGEMAVEFGLLPRETPVRSCVSWAWGRFMQSGDATALSPEEQVLANLRSNILARWGISIRRIDIASGGNREADGWYDDKAVYLRRDKLREFSGNAITEAYVAEVLKDKEFLVKTEKDGRLFTRYVKGLGKADVYALSRDEFGREDDGSMGSGPANDQYGSVRYA